MTANYLAGLRWPARPGNDLFPWYVIIWRVLWAPVLYGGLALAWVAVLATHGRRRARKFWRETT